MEYTLIGADGLAYRSSVPGALGGHRRNHGYGRLDCPAALRWIARGHYVRHRVFFADEATAIGASTDTVLQLPARALCGMEGRRVAGRARRRVT